jgi:hypothetical protein
LLVQHGHQDCYPYLPQEASPQRSRANGEVDGKVSFQDGLMGGMEKGNEASTRHENAHPGVALRYRNIAYYKTKELGLQAHRRSQLMKILNDGL